MILFNSGREVVDILTVYPKLIEKHTLEGIATRDVSCRKALKIRENG